MTGLVLPETDVRELLCRSLAPCQVSTGQEESLTRPGSGPQPLLLRPSPKTLGVPSPRWVVFLPFSLVKERDHLSSGVP